MRLPTTHRWLLAVAGSSLMLLATAVVVRIRRENTPSVATSLPGECDLPDEYSPRVMPEADLAPVLLFGAGAVRLFVDGAPAFGSPEHPLRLPPGEHELQMRAEGHTPLTTRFRLDGYTPALFHAQVDAEAGLTLVRLGAPCPTCPPPLREVELVQARSSEPSHRLFIRAAEGLRRDDWPQALRALEGVTAKDRTRPLFRRLAAGVFGATGQFSDARKQLGAIPKSSSNGLSELLDALEDLEKRERVRQRQVLRDRWDRTTERFAQLTQKFEAMAPAAMAEAARRLGNLSRAFDQAASRQDPYDQEQVLRAAESTVGGVVAQVRALRPDDCEFQLHVLTVATR